MRTAAMAFACLLAAAVAGRAAESSSTQSSLLPAFPRSRNMPPEQHALLPDVKQVQRPRDIGRPPRGRTCFDQSETRENIAAHRLSDPLHALQLGSLLGDALSAKLCRWSPDEFVYEVHVLRRDGRVLRVYMDATTGEAINGQKGLDREKDRN